VVADNKLSVVYELSLPIAPYVAGASKRVYSLPLSLTKVSGEYWGGASPYNADKSLRREVYSLSYLLDLEDP